MTLFVPEFIRPMFERTAHLVYVAISVVDCSDAAVGMTKNLFDQLVALVAELLCKSRGNRTSQDMRGESFRKMRAGHCQDLIGEARLEELGLALNRYAAHFGWRVGTDRRLCTECSAGSGSPAERNVNFRDG